MHCVQILCDLSSGAKLAASKLIFLLVTRAKDSPDNNLRKCDHVKDEIIVGQFWIDESPVFNLQVKSEAYLLK